MADKLNFPPNYKPWHTKGNYTAHHTNGEGFVGYEDASVYCEDLPKVELFMHDSGMTATHNMPCAICKINHAVFRGGLFEPCWSCQKEGYKVVKLKDNFKSKFIKWLLED